MPMVPGTKSGTRLGLGGPGKFPTIYSLRSQYIFSRYYDDHKYLPYLTMILSIGYNWYPGILSNKDYE